jgi:shikimate dehydrogenase
VSRYGVLGWPVAHSRSPAMFRALGVAYQKLPVAPEIFEETVRALPEAGFGGANVTIPHKEAALALADKPTERAAEIGAANTLTFEGGEILADNTDAPGFLAALPTEPRTALVLGAGGSARAVIWALRSRDVEVRVWNRTPERAAGLGVEVVDGAVDADLLVNCTSIGLGNASSPDLPTFKALPLEPDELDAYACVVDLVYRPGGTDLERAAREQGITTVSGLEVLVQQGALSYETWMGRPADRDAMRRAADDFDAPSTTTDTER